MTHPLNNRLCRVTKGLVESVIRSLSSNSLGMDQRRPRTLKTVFLLHFLQSHLSLRAETEVPNSYCSKYKCIVWQGHCMAKTLSSQEIFVTSVGYLKLISKCHHQQFKCLFWKTFVEYNIKLYMADCNPFLPSSTRSLTLNQT